MTRRLSHLLHTGAFVHRRSEAETGSRRSGPLFEKPDTRTLCSCILLRLCDGPRRPENAFDASPKWYAESLEKDDREYWDSCHGEGFYDWYLEMLIESAYRDPEPPRQERARERVIQPLLPGLSSLSLGNYYGLE